MRIMHARRKRRITNIEFKLKKERTAAHWKMESQNVCSMIIGLSQPRRRGSNRSLAHWVSGLEARRSSIWFDTQNPRGVLTRKEGIGFEISVIARGFGQKILGPFPVQLVFVFSSF